MDKSKCETKESVVEVVTSSTGKDPNLVKTTNSGGDANP